ncbi:hypothetical protein TrST_g667 [Triparma strigata]|uniref:Uncharacterized protein n=1 Tax=Triparma strigata TaxID=1606541 RepID=A0A9W7AL46_9STRA|nr:hypothetical protein TrST_g667 [Triparma strigata]
MKPIALVVFYLLNLSIVTSYVLNLPSNYRISSKLSSTKSSDSALTRSQFISKASQLTVGVGVGGLVFLGLPKASEAAGAGVTEEDIARLKKGKEGIDYLIQNWDSETTTCRENGGECKRDAQPVRKYMGLRSTTDPLFQIEKVFVKAKYMDIDPEDLEKYYEAMEDYNACMAMSNSMAFISQFGEYNPGGGKDEVLKYLDESKIQVKLAQKNLGIMMGILKIE